MGGRLQPPNACHAIIKAISTEADELNPEPWGTLDAKTAFIAGVAILSCMSDHITPAGYNPHSGSGDESIWVFDGTVPAEKVACWSKSAATSVEWDVSAAEKAMNVARSMAAGITSPS